MQSLIGSVVNGSVWTKEDYKQWRLNQIGRGERLEALRDKLAERVTQANETAVAYVNDATPGIYSLNRNYTAYTIEQVSDSADFALWDERTVRRLVKEQPNLMPYYPKKMALKRGIDLEYGKKQITASITSSILQGKSVKQMADDLQERITTMSRVSAIRTARTAVTGAQNAGRMDSYKAAEGMGIKLKKRWLATLDNRTRHAHAKLDGQTVDVDKPFEIDGKQIMYPGDRSAAGYLVYNCRCTTIAVLPDVDMSDAQRWSKDPETGERKLVSDMTYQEWAGWKEKEQKTVANARAVLNKHGQVILFDSRLESEHYSDSVSIIRQLSSEYDTKLVNVRNFEKGENTLSVAGDVSPFGEMRLSSNKKETAVHEFAHSLALTKDSKLGLDGNDAFWKEIRKVRSEYNKYIRQHPTDKISFYAADNVDEFFAEAFTHAKSKQLGIALPDYYGTDYTYSDKVLEIVDKYFKKDVASANGNGIIKMGNRDVREWYKESISQIPSLIDQTLSVEQQAKQAFEARNRIRSEARKMMADEATRKILDEERPNKTFEELIESKMKRKGMSREEAILDILETATKSNADVDRELGLGGD